MISKIAQTIAINQFDQQLTSCPSAMQDLNINR